MLEILKKVIDAQNSFYNALDLEVHDFITENESAKYHAHSYCLKNKNILFRIAQKTPTKTGWFVTAWKRDSNKITTPYDHLDQVDFLIINIVNNNKVGQFVFPKTALIKENIFSISGKGGKRGFRIYSPWDQTNSEQATQTKKWQSQFFVDMTSKNSESIKRVKNLYSV